jgi:hypothetical protein
MQVGKAATSHAEIWRDGSVPQRTLAAKCAAKHRLGDLFNPKERGKDPFSPQCYHEPIPGHSHANEKCPTQWHEDIDYVGAKGRRPALLIGDPDRSFLWSRARIRLKGWIIGPTTWCWSRAIDEVVCLRGLSGLAPARRVSTELGIRFLYWILLWRRISDASPS